MNLKKNQILFHKYFVRMNILYIFVEIIKKSTTMKNLIFLLSVLFLTSCGTNKMVSKPSEVVLIPCIYQNPGDTAVILPFEDYFYEGAIFSNFEDTLRISDYSKTYCPIP